MTDPHAPTSAGPEPGTGWIPVGDGTDDQSGGGADPMAELMERPEAQLGAAFAGGILAALILKRFGRR